MEEFHEAANIFPLMDDAALGELAADIAANGLREPIWRHRDGRIIDGRNRWLACAKVGVTCHAHTYQYDDDSIVPFVISHNLHRRHLTESQRALIAGRLANMPEGNPNFTTRSSEQVVSNARAAELLNVSEMTARRGRKVVERGVPELTEAVREQKLSIHAAAQIASHKPEEQRRRLKPHLDQGGSDKRQKGTPKMKAPDPIKPKIKLVHDRDDGLVEQVCALLHRLREVAGKSTPDDLYSRIPDRLMHNLDLSLDRATWFLTGLQDVHRARSAERKNAAV